MEIIKRHKNSTGEIIGYTVKQNNKTQFVDKDTILKIEGLIENATLTSSGDFRANKGYTIETVINNQGLLTTKDKTKLNIVDNTKFETDYYGAKYINICRKFRRYALEGNIIVSKDKHSKNEGANLHLFKLIESCGISIDNFVRGYLSVIQPYSLKRFQSTVQLSKYDTWVCDIGYKVSLLIKMRDNDPKKPIIVSFHESNILGKSSKGQQDFSDKPCAVIVDTVKQINNIYKVKFTVQRGFIRYSDELTTEYYNNGVALVNYNQIKENFDTIINNIFNNIKKTYSDSISDISAVEITPKSVNDLSFISLGYASTNNIYLLLDLYAKFNDNKSRILLAEIANNIIEEMPRIQKIELKEALEQKFEVSKKNIYNNKLYELIKGLL